MNIRTERLFIRQLSETDAAFIFELLNTERWIRYIGNRNIHSETDTLAYIRKINENPDVKVVMPGHGGYENKELLDYTINLFKNQ